MYMGWEGAAGTTEVVFIFIIKVEEDEFGKTPLPREDLLTRRSNTRKKKMI